MITTGLADTQDGHIRFDQLAKLIFVFIPMWWIWITHTLYSNRFDDDLSHHRVQTLGLMSAIVVLILFSSDVPYDGFSIFTSLYSAIRLFQSFMYIRVYVTHKDEIGFAKDVAIQIGVTALITLSSALFSGYVAMVVFYGGIILEMIWQYSIRGKLRSRPIDKSHMIERLGLLAIIILGESMISIVGGLTIEQFNPADILSAVSGFAIICLIWWVYFSYYDRFERSTRIFTGDILIFMHLFLCQGLLILAALIEHAILNDLDRSVFGTLAIIGLTLFYIGKQIPYMFAFPVLTFPIVVTTGACFVATFLATLLPSVEYQMLGLLGAVFLYILMTQWTLSYDISAYTDDGMQHDGNEYHTA
ncbi:low temperature requirement protein A [Stomatohabitans albus]